MMEPLPHLIHRVELSALEEALGQAQGHGRVVGPLARLEPERPSTRHVSERFERAAGRELDSRSNRIAAGQTDQGTAGTIDARPVSHGEAHGGPLCHTPSSAKPWRVGTRGLARRAEDEHPRNLGRGCDMLSLERPGTSEASTPRLIALSARPTIGRMLTHHRAP
jgi:hypothetical protein